MHRVRLFLYVLLCIATFVLGFAISASPTETDADRVAMCQSISNFALTLADRAHEFTPEQSLAILRELDPNYAQYEGFYTAMVPYVYARRHLTKTALYVETWQGCMDAKDILQAMRKGIR